MARALEKATELWHLRRAVEAAATGDCEPAEAWVALRALGARLEPDDHLASLHVQEEGTSTVELIGSTIITRLVWHGPPGAVLVRLLAGHRIVAESVPCTELHALQPFAVQRGSALQAIVGATGSLLIFGILAP